MLNLLRFAPYVLLVAVLGYGAHWLIVNNLENTITTQENRITQLQENNATLNVAATINEGTIRSLEMAISEQTRLTTVLTTANQGLQEEKDEYLSIFRRHDLSRLALARPGLIEPRINNGTKEVFDQLEEERYILQQNEIIKYYVEATKPKNIEEWAALNEAKLREQLNATGINNSLPPVLEEQEPGFFSRLWPF